MLVKESLYNFKRESDPIQSSGLGIKTLIEKWVQNHVIDYTYKTTRILPTFGINDDLTINVVGTCYLSNQKIIEFPEYIQFNKINGGFYANNCELISLKGFPKLIKGNCQFYHNDVTSLEGIPAQINGNLNCKANGVKFKLNDILHLCTVKGEISC